MALVVQSTIASLRLTAPLTHAKGFVQSDSKWCGCDSDSDLRYTARQSTTQLGGGLGLVRCPAMLLQPSKVCFFIHFYVYVLFCFDVVMLVLMLLLTADAMMLCWWRWCRPQHSLCDDVLPFATVRRHTRAPLFNARACVYVLVRLGFRSADVLQCAVCACVDILDLNCRLNN